MTINENLKITFDSGAGMIILDMLKLEHKCSFCGKEITKETLGGIFPKPTRISCKDLTCLLEAIG